MSARAPALLAGLAAAPAHIIHIGAGQARDLATYLASGAAQVTLIEADPDIAAALEAQTGSENRVRVICAAVSPNRDTRPFHRLSLPDLNAFLVPDTARDLFPGLRLISSDPLAPVAPEDLIGGLETAGEGPEILVIEAPGEALGIVRALAAADLLQRFERLRLQEARASLFSAVAPVEDLHKALADAGFIVEADPAGDDPDMPVWIARVDQEKKLRQRIARLTAERDHAHARIDALRQERNAAQNRVETLEAEGTAAQGRIAELEAEGTAAQGRIAELEAEGAAAQGRIAELEAEGAAAQGRIAELEAEGAAAQGRIADLEAEGTAAQGRIAELEAEKTAAAEDWRGQVAELGARCDTLTEALDGKTRALADAERMAQYRLAQGRQEVLRLEGQIRLIRDLLLNRTEP